MITQLLKRKSEHLLMKNLEFLKTLEIITFHITGCCELFLFEMLPRFLHEYL